MNPTAFKELLTSSGTLKPSRVTTFRPADVKSVREKLRASQTEFALMIGDTGRPGLGTPACGGARSPRNGGSPAPTPQMGGLAYNHCETLRDWAHADRDE